MKANRASGVTTEAAMPKLIWAAIALLIPLGILFSKSFHPAHVVFSNDGPLGQAHSSMYSLPEGFTGMWQDLTWVGGWSGSALPTITYFLLWSLGPVGFAKFYAPACLFILGVSAWLLFRQLGFRPVVCVLGGLVAALNMDFFSYACWGLGTHVLCIAATFLALAALVSPIPGWARLALGGFAVGMSVMEGFDNGAIFSLYVAAFVVFQSLVSAGKPGLNFAKGMARTACLALFAVFIAAQAISILTGTQIKGIVGTKQDQATRDANWAFATQFSLPKIETLRILIPGVFGYGLPEMYGRAADSVGGANYWGSVGQDPTWEAYLNSPTPPSDPAKMPRGQPRFNGSGTYVGVLVALIAIWAVVQSLRKKVSLFSANEKKYVWFWAAMAFLSLLLSFGRFAAFYQFVYALPYFSTIRNPVKFLHPFNVAVIILFGYGLQALCRRYQASSTATASSIIAHLKAWWATAPAFDKRWTQGCIFFIGASLLGWMLYSSSRNELEQHLQRVAFTPELAKSIATFSLRDVGVFVFFLALSVFCVTLLLSGWFAGRRATWLGWVMGILLFADLGRANLPWIVHYNYKEKYATNPVIDILRDKPYEHRVTAPTLQVPPELAYFRAMIYFQDWLQNIFPFYDVQSLDFSQMPRMSEEFRAYDQALRGATLRLWQLTNTRYVLAPAAFLAVANEKLDPVQQRFRIHTWFEFYQTAANGPILLRTNMTGPFALFEFTGALPRAGLYAKWQISTNDAEALKQLANPAFDPTQTVLVADSAPPTPTMQGTNQNPGTVKHTSYAPKRVVLEADAKAPCVLLLNDKFDPQWKVWVDGRPETVLRCNYLMRGVYLTSGKHTVQFRFVSSTTPLFVSLTAIVLGIGLCGFLAFTKRRGDSASEAAASNSVTPSPPATPQSAIRNPNEPSRRHPR